MLVCPEVKCNLILSVMHLSAVRCSFIFLGFSSFFYYYYFGNSCMTPHWLPPCSFCQVWRVLRISSLQNFSHNITAVFCQVVIIMSQELCWFLYIINEGLCAWCMLAFPPPSPTHSFFCHPRWSVNGTFRCLYGVSLGSDLQKPKSKDNIRYLSHIVVRCLQIFH